MRPNSGDWSFILAGYQVSRARSSQGLRPGLVLLRGLTTTSSWGTRAQKTNQSPHPWLRDFVPGQTAPPEKPLQQVYNYSTTVEFSTCKEITEASSSQMHYISPPWSPSWSRDTLTGNKNMLLSTQTQSHIPYTFTHACIAPSRLQHLQVNEGLRLEA